jgi:hypothetical protein
VAMLLVRFWHDDASSDILARTRGDLGSGGGSHAVQSGKKRGRAARRQFSSFKWHGGVGWSGGAQWGVMPHVMEGGGLVPTGGGQHRTETGRHGQRRPECSVGMALPDRGFQDQEEATDVWAPQP